MVNTRIIMKAAVVLLAMAAVSGVARAEEQPRMEAALKNLREARENLEQASKDKGGHRVKAIKLINEAIEEVKAGIKYDNKH